MSISATSNAYYSTMNYQAPSIQSASTANVGVQSTGGGLSSGDFTTISSMVATGAGGGFAAFKMLGRNPGASGFKHMLGTGLKGAGIAGLVSAGVSAVGNGIGVATGQIDSSTAVGNVLTDALSGTAGGLGAMAVGGIGRALLGKVGMAGVPLTIATVVLGTLAGTAAGQHARAFISGKLS